MLANKIIKNYPFKDEYLEAGTPLKPKRKFPLSLIVLHYSVTDWGVKKLAEYCHSGIVKDGRKSSWNFSVGKKGDTIVHLPLDIVPIANAASKNNGYWTDHEGNWTWRVNDIGVAFETDYTPDKNKEWTDETYEAVAERCKWIILTTEHTRVWRITGHEFLVPAEKFDPSHLVNWKKFFVDYLQVKPEIYNQCLSFMDELKSDHCKHPIPAAKKAKIVKEKVLYMEKVLKGLKTSDVLQEKW